MSEYSATQHDARPGEPRFRAVLAFAVALSYCQLFLVNASPVWPEALRGWMRSCAGVANQLVSFMLGWVGVDKSGLELRSGLYLVLTAGVVPWLASRLVMGSPLQALGFRMPNRLGWRMIAVGYLAALPFVIFMAAGSGMARFYLPSVRSAGLPAILAYFSVNMLTEHFLFHGILLGAFRPDFRWPAKPADVVIDGMGSSWRRMLLYLGLSGGRREPGQWRITAWLQLQRGCGAAILGSAALFALVHVGKDWREAVLSFPGGLALAFIAYRSNSWLAPFLLHLLTAGTTLAIMMLSHR